jgi:hypothetical protein
LSAEVYRGRGDGTFAAEIQLAALSTVSLSNGSFRDNGPQDLALGSASGTAELLGRLSDCRNSYGCPSIDYGSAGSFAAGDFDGDGRVDDLFFSPGVAPQPGYNC